MPSQTLPEVTEDPGTSPGARRGPLNASAVILKMGFLTQQKLLFVGDIILLVVS